MSQPATIPLRNSAGRLIDAEADYNTILSNAAHFRLKYNKRGNVTCATVRERLSTIPLTRTGEHYRQQLDSGRIISTLRGTPGAQSAVIL